MHLDQGCDNINPPVSRALADGLGPEDLSGRHFKQEFEVQDTVAGHQGNPVVGQQIDEVISNTGGLCALFIQTGAGRVQVKDTDDR